MADLGGISVQDVTKTFRIYQEQFRTLKERALHFGKIPYHEFDAVHQVSFNVPPGSMTGLLGHNGSGKSTLLKCIAGTLRQSTGTIQVQGRMAALLELGAGFHPELTGRENLYLAGSILGLKKHEITSRLDRIVEFAELGDFIDNQMKHYSTGMFARLGFALSVHVEPEILLIDEVLAVGDEAFQLKCLDQIRRFHDEGVTMLFVTHDVYLAASICDKIIVLDHGRVIAQGDPSEAAITYRQYLHTDEAITSMEITSPNGAISFGNINFLVDGRQITTIRPLDVVTMNVEIIMNEQVNDLVVAYAIREIGGNIINSSNTHLLTTDLSNISSRTVLSFTFNSFPLLNGMYEVDLGAHSSDGKTLYTQSNQASRFTLTGSSKSAGVVDLAVEARVIN